MKLLSEVKQRLIGKKTKQNKILSTSQLKICLEILEDVFRKPRKCCKVASLARTLIPRQMGWCMLSGGWPSLLEEQKPLQVVRGALKYLPSLITEAGKSFHGIRGLKQIHCDTYIFWFQFMPRWKWWEVEISWDQLLPGRSRDEHPGPGWAPGEGKVGTRGRSQFEAPETNRLTVITAKCGTEGWQGICRE